jgi:hypothetical protein
VGKEAYIQAKAIRECKKRGWLAFKVVSPGNAGFPDLLIIAHKTAYFFEMKRHGKTPSPLQKKMLSVLRKHGMFADWADSIGYIVHAISTTMLGKMFQT